LSETRLTIRLDKWLWHARFFKTRTLAAKQVTGGHVRVNSEKAQKASHSVGPGDTLTFPQGRVIRVIEITEIGERRGPAPEAQALYVDHTPPPEPKPVNPALTRVGGRPTKKDRRNLDRIKEDFKEP